MYKKIGFMQNFKDCVTKKYFKFNGRASRQEYFKFMLVTIIIEQILSLITKGLFFMNMNIVANYVDWLSIFFSIFIFLPFLSVMARRLHDTNKSSLLILAPIFVIFIIVGIEYVFRGILTLNMLYIFLIVYFVICIFLFICTLLKGNVGTNKYGDDPYED